MRLLVCIITYNRLEYTKKTLKDLFYSLEDPYYLVAVDNGSTDGTVEYLRNLTKRGRMDMLVENGENRYPGAAANIGFDIALTQYPEATHLMRLDNDMHLEYGWYDKSIGYFEDFPMLGQLGLDIGPQRAHGDITTTPDWVHEAVNGKKISHWPGNVGGTCIIRRDLWDEGLRYDETPWPESEVPQIQEDAKLSIAVRNMGFQFGHATEHLANTIDDPADYPEYYDKTYTERGYK